MSDGRNVVVMHAALVNLVAKEFDFTKPGKGTGKAFKRVKESVAMGDEMVL